MKKKLTNCLLTLLSCAATRMSVLSLSEISAATWYQPRTDADLEDFIKNRK